MGVSQGAITVTTSSTQIVAANPKRRGVAVTNNGTATIWIGLASENSAAELTPLFQSEKMTMAGDDEAYKGAIWGVVEAGTQDARFLEYSY